MKCIRMVQHIILNLQLFPPLCCFLILGDMWKEEHLLLVSSCFLSAEDYEEKKTGSEKAIGLVAKVLTCNSQSTSSISIPTAASF